MGLASIGATGGITGSSILSCSHDPLARSGSQRYQGGTDVWAGCGPADSTIPLNTMGLYRAGTAGVEGGRCGVALSLGHPFHPPAEAGGDAVAPRVTGIVRPTRSYDASLKPSQ